MYVVWIYGYGKIVTDISMNGKQFHFIQDVS